MRYLIYLLLLLGLSACGYSPAVLKNAYENMGERYATELKQLIPLNEEQKAGVDAFAVGLQQWHRQYRLPEYAALVSRLGDELQQDKPITDQDLLEVVNTLSLYPHFQQAKDSNRQLAVLAETLSDEQLDRLAQQIGKDLQEQEEQLLAMSDEKDTSIVREKMRKAVLDLIPGSLVLRLFLTPDELFGRSVRRDGPLEHLYGEGIELLDAQDGYIVDSAGATSLEQVVIDLATAQDDPNYVPGIDVLDLTDHRSKSAFGKLIQAGGRQAMPQQTFRSHDNQWLAVRS